MKLSLLLLVTSWSLAAQTTTAQLTGTITDSLGATIAGARVMAVNTATNIENETLSNELGLYRIPALPPGAYRVRAERTGFRPVVQDGLQLSVNQTARLDFALPVGDVKETLSVTAETPLLQTDDSALGGLVDNAKIINLPLNGRNPFSLAALEPGVQPQGGFFTPRVFQEPTLQANFTVNGSASMTNEIMIDGTSNIVAGHGQLALTPSIDGIEEFRILSSTFSAEFGRTGGGVVNIVTKAGTNQFHGSLFHFLRNRVLDANNFFNNRSNVGRPPFVFNQFGGAIGGPIRKNRTFFFFNYDGTQVRRGVVFIGTVPTAEQRTGSFARTLTANGQLVTISNPFSTRAQGSGFVRDAFPGNQLPGSMIDPVARRVTTFYPSANLPGVTNTGANNFLANASQVNELSIWQGRVDHQFSEKHRMFFRYSQDEQIDVPPNFFGNLATTNSFGPGVQPDYHGTLGTTHTVNSSTILEFRYGYARNGFDRRSESDGLDLTELGFPRSFAGAVQSSRFPAFMIGGMSQVGAFPTARFFLGADTHMAVLQGTMIRGRHSLKAGVDARSYRHNSFSGGNNAGTFNFSPGFTQGPNPLVSGPSSGFGYASFLLGTPAGGTAVIRSSIAYCTNYWAGYLQDDWRVSNRLTLNVGLRYDYESPRFERHNRLAFFDTGATLPFAQEIGLPNLRGALGFVGVNGAPDGQSDPQYRNFGPRFGFAYTPFKNLVVRGGYGITYLPQGTARNCCGAGQDGFTTTTSMTTSFDGVTPANLLRDPFPTGLIAPTGSSLGPRTLIGQGIAGFVRDVPNGYSQQFNLNVQRQTAGFVLSAGWVASRGINIPISYALNQLADEHLALGSGLLTQVPNPFFGIVTGGGPNSGRTIARGRLLRPYPQFDGIGYPNLAGGTSTYHSLQTRLERRFGKGVSVLASYTWSKFLSDVSSDKGFAGDIAAPIQNSNNRRLDWSLSPQDIAHRMVANFVYDVPFGMKRWFGGWQLTGIATAQSGRPLILSNQTNNTNSLGGGSRPNSTGRSARLSGDQRTIDRWFDTSAFIEPAPFTFGNIGRTLPDVREPGLVNFDFSVMKNTQITERWRLQFRAEIFNLSNTPQFGTPGTVFGTGQFGVLSRQANNPRQVQFGLKLLF
jgi:hypothetical protein